jgi:hypothetical protein
MDLVFMYFLSTFSNGLEFSVQHDSPPGMQQRLAGKKSTNVVTPFLSWSFVSIATTKHCNKNVLDQNIDVLASMVFADESNK